MAIPASVRKQGELADKLQKEAIEGKPEKAPVTDTPPDDKTTPAQPAVEEPGKQAITDPDDFKTKYLVLQGKYNAEVPQLNLQVREQAESLAGLQEQINKLTAAPAPPAEPEPKPEPEVFITEEQREEYGPGLVDFIQNASREALGNEVLSLTKRVDEVSKRMDGVTNQVAAVSQDQLTTTKQKFWDSVLGLLPDYDTINKNPDYLAWLSEKDPMSGIERQKLLEDAFKGYNVERFTVFPITWKAIHQPDSSSPDTTVVLPNEETPFPEKGGGSGNPLDEPDAPLKLTKAFVSKFYKDCSLGKYAKRKDEAIRIEKQINEATAAGTITA